MPEQPMPDADDAHRLERIVAELASACERDGLRLATAESCTGGWVAKLLTDRAGSSGWFAGGVVAYADSAKSDLLGVDPELIRSQGAVSRDVVCAMAEGALRAFRADLAVAVSGVAGPGGGSATKPVGTVWFAWATGGTAAPDGDPGTEAEQERLAGDRDAVRRASVRIALEGLLARVTPGA